MWTNEIVRIVRFLINDIESVSYTDDRLEETILVAAQLLQSTMDFDTTYTVDVDQVTLSPDPTEGTKDNFFINCLAMKAAIIVLGSECKTSAAQAYRIKDATSSLDSTASYQSLHQLYKELTEQLAKYIMDYRAGNSIVGGCVITPTTYEGTPYGGVEMRNFY